LLFSPWFLLNIFSIHFIVFSCLFLIILLNKILKHMKKNLFLIHMMLCGIVIPASAQFDLSTQSPMGAGRPANVQRANAVQVIKGEDANTRTVACSDKVTWTSRNPEVGTTKVGGNNWDVVIQEFPDYTGQVTAVEFRGATYTAGTKTCEVDIYNPSTFAILATTTANITSTTTGNISVTFPTPANVSNGFMVGIWRPAGDSVKIGVSTSGGGFGYVYAQVGTTFYNWLSDFGFDNDLLISPTIKFNAINPVLSATPTTVCTGQSVSFSDNPASSFPIHYNHDIYNPNGIDEDMAFGDGATATSGSGSHTYATSGTKVATLKYIYDGWTTDCTSDPSTQTITVTPGTVANFAWSATNLAVTFTNMSTGASTYSWAFGDAGTASAPNPVHNLAASGTYTVELTATGSCGSDMHFTNITITDSTNGGIIGIVEIKDGLLTNIYPNPAGNNINVDLSLNTTENVSMQVISSLGQVVYNRELGAIRSSLQTIDLSAYEAGVYFVRIVHNNTVTSRTFVKQ